LTDNPSVVLSDRSVLIGMLILFGIVLTATTIRGVFIIDEDNYLATVVGLRHGTLFAPGTEGLTPSRELVWFDPEAGRRVVQSTPVVSLVPPLYAFIAFPFSYAGWRGLVFLNILSFLATIYIVFCYVKTLTHRRASPWIAAILFALGGYCIEYSQGMWPQMLSVALCLGSVFIGSKARREGSLGYALLAGILIGIATGIREQNIFFAGCLGLGLLLYSPRKVRIATGYVVGVAILLAIIATLNFNRFGIWHPFPKIVSYSQEVGATTVSSSMIEPLRVLWSKVVDYSSYGPNTAHIRGGYYQWDALSGTVLMNGIVKKSWIQSSPWIGLSLIVMIIAWVSFRTKGSDTTKEIRLIGLIVLPTLLMFAVAGFDRTDGLSFNQRYFLELLPLSAITLSLVLDGATLKFFHLSVGSLTGFALVVLILVLPQESMRHLGQRYLPLLLALALVLVWYFSNAPRLISLLLGICVGWALFSHLETDLVGSRFRREINAARYSIMEKTIPDHSALFTYWGNKDAAGPLQLANDIVILDVWADGGVDAGQLENQLLAANRRVFILENDMPTETLGRLLANRTVSDHTEENFKLVEVSNR